MKKDKKNIILFIVILLLIIIFTCGILISNNYKNKKRYQQIKNDIDQELKRYMYVIAPRCQDGNSTIITHEDLVYNAGMNKEKFLDVDGESYCKVYIKSECKNTKWNWNINISCKNYQDKEYVDWAKSFDDKK